MRLTIIAKAAVEESRELDWHLKEVTPNACLQHYQCHLCYTFCYSLTWSVSVPMPLFADIQIQKSKKYFLFTFVCYVQNTRLMTYQRPFALSMVSGKVVSSPGCISYRYSQVQGRLNAGLCARKMCRYEWVITERNHIQIVVGSNEVWE